MALLSSTLYSVFRCEQVVRVGWLEAFEDGNGPGTGAVTGVPLGAHQALVRSPKSRQQLPCNQTACFASLNQ